jgi:hypothetical protein
VAPSQVGSVEFAASLYGTRLVVVMGHSQCGAVIATLEELLGRAPSSRTCGPVDRVRPRSVRAPLERDASRDADTRRRRANVCVGGSPAALAERWSGSSARRTSWSSGPVFMKRASWSSSVMSATVGRGANGSPPPTMVLVNQVVESYGGRIVRYTGRPPIRPVAIPSPKAMSTNIPGRPGCRRVRSVDCLSTLPPAK